jgi:RNA polymerase sigma-70 factor (ECF subfamily)
VIIYKISSSYCKEIDDRSDLIQEIILKLWKSFNSYNYTFKYSTWIYRIASSTSISFCRKNRKRQQSTTELSTILENTLLAEESIQESPELKVLQKIIEELKEIDKAIILLYLDKLSQKEIATIIGISPTNVGTKLSRIKKKLQHRFKSTKKKSK